MRDAVHTRTFVRDDGETEVDVSFGFAPGTPESGNFGPPEDYDPGSGPEFHGIRATRCDDPDASVELTPAEIERFETETMEDRDFDPVPSRPED